MVDCYILVVDADVDFCMRVSQLLPATGVRLVGTEVEDEALLLLARHRPKLVFLGVELPDKEGFSLFSKIKKAQRNVPVVLTTASVSKADMKMHENLRVHADAYVNKREVTDDELMEIMARRMGVSSDELGVGGPIERLQTDSDSTTEPAEAGSPEPPAPPSRNQTELTEESDDAVAADNSELARVPAALDTPRRPAPELDPRLSQFLDPETEAIFAEVDEEATELAATTPSSPGELTPERLTELEQLTTRLEEQLEQARSDAKSSPFSSDFLSLREAANRKQEEIDALAKTVARRDGYVLIVKRKLVELAMKIVEAQKDKEHSAEDANEWKHQLGAAQRRAEQVVEELDEQQKLHEQEIEALKQAVAEEQVRVTVTRHELDGQITELRAAQSKIVHENEQARAIALKELESILREEKATATAELKEKYTAKLKEVDDTRSRSSAESRAEHDKAIAALHETHREALGRAAAQAQETLREVSEKSAAALEQANEQRVAELAGSEEKRLADLNAAKEHHVSKIESLALEHNAAREDLEKKAEAAVKANEAMLEEVNAKVQDVLMSWEKERQLHHQTRARYEKDLAEIQSVHTKNLNQAEQDQFSVLTGLSRKFRDERTSALDAERARGAEKLRDLAQRHAAELASLTNRHSEQLTSLQQAHASELATRERHREQEFADAVTRATAKLSSDHETAKHTHAGELAALRQLNERDSTALQSAHMETLARRDQEAQKALREAIDQAKADTSEQVEQMDEEHSRALANLRSEYEDELATLEEVHRSSVQQQDETAGVSLRRAEDERHDARVTIDTLRAEMAELEAKHRSDFTILEERQKADVKDLRSETKTRVSQLDDEKQFLAASVEKLKRQSAMELKRATDALDHEKQLHNGTRERYEKRVSELKQRHTDGIERVESDWMKKLDNLEANLYERSEKAGSGAERGWKAKLDQTRHQHEATVTALRKDFDTELAATQLQLERASEFAASNEVLSRELADARVNLESTSTELAIAQAELTERNRLLAENEKRVSANKETIDSLKSVINDFTHTVQGYVQDRDDQDQTISALKEVISDMHRSIDQVKESS